VAAIRTVGAVDGREAALLAFAGEGASAPRFRGNGPRDTYGRHDHGFHKVLFCLAGSIVFHTDGGDVELRPGDRLDLDPGTGHAATVGPEGCECVEASR
jgi:mannose-6-phosphate isomerase-like protein (cupin superfamily)